MTHAAQHVSSEHPPTEVTGLAWIGDRLVISGEGTTRIPGAEVAGDGPLVFDGERLWQVSDGTLGTLDPETLAPEPLDLQGTVVDAAAGVLAVAADAHLVVRVGERTVEHPLPGPVTRLSLAPDGTRILAAGRWGSVEGPIDGPLDRHTEVEWGVHLGDRWICGGQVRHDGRCIDVLALDGRPLGGARAVRTPAGRVVVACNGWVWDVDPARLGARTLPIGPRDRPAGIVSDGPWLVVLAGNEGIVWRDERVVTTFTVSGWSPAALAVGHGRAYAGTEAIEVHDVATGRRVAVWDVGVGHLRGIRTTPDAVLVVGSTGAALVSLDGVVQQAIPGDFTDGDVHPDGTVVLASDGGLVVRDGPLGAAGERIRFSGDGEHVLVTDRREGRVLGWPSLAPLAATWAWTSAERRAAGGWRWVDGTHAGLVDPRSPDGPIWRYHQGPTGLAGDGDVWFTTNGQGWIGVRGPDGAILRQLPSGFGERPLGLAFSEDGARIAAVDARGRLAVWAVDGGVRLVWHHTPDEPARVNPDDPEPLAGPVVFADGIVAATGVGVRRWPDRDQPRSAAVLSWGDEHRAARHLTPDGRFVLGGEPYNGYTVTRVADGEVLLQLDPIDGTEVQVRLTDDGAWLVVADGPELVVWSVVDRTRLATLEVGGARDGFHVTPDGQVVVWVRASEDDDDPPRLVFVRWDPRTGDIARWITGSPEWIGARVRFSGDGRRVLLVGATCRVLEPGVDDDGKRLGGFDHLRMAALDRTGRQLVTMSFHGGLALYDVDRECCLARFGLSHDGTVWLEEGS